MREKINMKDVADSFTPRYLLKGLHKMIYILSYQRQVTSELENMVYQAVELPLRSGFVNYNLESKRRCNFYF